jgi:glycosyltransferase involved in cell wall biosynthesis
MTLDLSVAMLVKNPPIDRLATLVDYLSPIASEFVIVDTGSSDEFIQAYVRWNKAPWSLPKVVVIRAEFKNDFAAARNIGVKACTRKWTLVVDPDELPSQRMVSHIADVVRGDQGTEDAAGYLYFTRNYWEGILEPEAEFHWHVRLFRTGRGRFYRALDELVELDGLPEHDTRGTTLLPKAPKEAYLIHSKAGDAIEQSKRLYNRLRE